MSGSAERQQFVGSWDEWYKSITTGGNIAIDPPDRRVQVEFVEHDPGVMPAHASLTTEAIRHAVGSMRVHLERAEAESFFGTSAVKEPSPQIPSRAVRSIKLSGLTEEE